MSGKSLVQVWRQMQAQRQQQAQRQAAEERAIRERAEQSRKEYEQRMLLERSVAVSSSSAAGAGAGGGGRRQTQTSFISRWNLFGSGSITLPLYDGGIYNFVVEWGDGLSDTITAFDQAEVLHSYAEDGEYTVTITGQCEGFNFS
jgi:hypothetical protein